MPTSAEEFCSCASSQVQTANVVQALRGSGRETRRNNLFFFSHGVGQVLQKHTLIILDFALAFTLAARLVCKYVVENERENNQMCPLRERCAHERDNVCMKEKTHP